MTKSKNSLSFGLHNTCTYPITFRILHSPPRLQPRFIYVGDSNSSHISNLSRSSFVNTRDLRPMLDFKLPPPLLQPFSTQTSAIPFSSTSNPPNLSVAHPKVTCPGKWFLKSYRLLVSNRAISNTARCRNHSFKNQAARHKKIMSTVYMYTQSMASFGCKKLCRNTHFKSWFPIIMFNGPVSSRCEGHIAGM